MSNYVKATDFAAKDALTTGNPLKLIKGTEINDELNAIQTAVATKADLASPAFTGNPTASTQTTGNSSTRLATTAFVNNQIDADILALALGTLSTQNADNVAITGGSITQLTTLTIPSAATAVTQSINDNSTKVATTAFVNAEIANDIGNSFTGSNQSLSVNGYQKLPGGLVLQWGSAGSIAQDQSVTVTFPTPFPNACLGGFANNQNVASVGGTNLNAGARNWNTTTMIVTNDGVTSGVHNWFAIGY